jgi:UDPglucose 6-dehydrogenase
MREAPSLVLIEQLLKAGATVKVYDPVAIGEARRHLGDTIIYSEDMYETLINADALAVVTEWSEFRMPNFKVMEKLLLKKVIFDGRNIYDPNEMKENGYVYYSIGRSTVYPENS